MAGYIGEFEIVDDRRGGKIVVNLLGRLNKCGVISPRFDMKVADHEKWVQNLLPARQFGFIVLTTSAGIMDHEEARRKHTGGKILGNGPSAACPFATRIGRCVPLLTIVFQDTSTEPCTTPSTVLTRSINTQSNLLSLVQKGKHFISYRPHESVRSLIHIDALWVLQSSSIVALLHEQQQAIRIRSL